MSTQAIAQIKGVQRHTLTIEYLIIPFEGTIEEQRAIERNVPKGFHLAGYECGKPFKLIFCRNRPKGVVEIDAP